MAFGFGFGMWRRAGSGLALIRDWILTTGFWRDEGKWDDAAVWKD